jgi:hypothetical protein
VGLVWLRALVVIEALAGVCHVADEVLIEDGEIWATANYIVASGAFAMNQFHVFCLSQGVSGKNGKYPLMKLITKLADYRKDSSKVVIKRFEKEDVETELKFENLQKLRIINQERMGVLIPRKLAKDRVRKTLLATLTALRYAIKRVSPHLAMKELSSREVENMITREWNDCIEELEKASKNVSWDAEGLEDQLGRTELAADAGEDISSGGDEEAEAESEE